MNAQTPISVERGILELLADPILLAERARDLLEATRTAETVQQKAIAAKIDADSAMKAAADELTKAREVQDINTKKSARLAEMANELAEREKAMAAEKADTVARMAEWERSLKEYEATLKARGEHLDALGQDLAKREHALEEAIAAAQATIDRAERIKAASEG